MKILDAYKQILRDVVHDDMQLEPILLRALVLHTHSIVLRSSVVIEDLPSKSDQGLVLAPLTRTHVTELISSLWPKRGSADFWFTEYCSLVAYEVFDEVPPELRARALEARASIADHHLVQELIEE